MSTAFQDVGEARRAHQVTEARRSARHIELLRRVCHELLSGNDLPSVLLSVLNLAAEHVGSEIAYLRVIDHGPPAAVFASARGISGREIDALTAWLDERPGMQRGRQRTATERARSELSLERFPVGDQPDMDGVLVLDSRASLGPAAFDDHSVIVAVAALIADAIRSRREAPHVRSRPSASQSTVSTAAAPQVQTIHADADVGPIPRRSLKAMLMSVEREILVEALRNADDNYSRAARALQTTPRILAYRLKRHGLHVGPRKPVP